MLIALLITAPRPHGPVASRHTPPALLAYNRQRHNHNRVQQQQNPILQLQSAGDVLRMYEERGHTMGPRELSMCWSALGNIVRRDYNERNWLRSELRCNPPALQPLLDATMESMDSFQPRPIAGTAHGLALVAGLTDFMPADPEWEALAQRSVQVVNGFDARALANTVYAFSKAERSSPALFEAVAAAALPRLREFKPQELSNTVWAFATAEHAAPALFDAVAEEATPRLRDFKPQELSNTVWAFATAAHAAPTLFDAVAREAGSRLRDFKPQELANTVWAFATAAHAADDLLDAVACVAIVRLRDFKNMEMIMMIWAYATAGREARDLFTAVADEAPSRIRQFRPQNFANLVWSFATIGHPSPSLFRAVAYHAPARLHEFDAQDMSNTAWAFASAGQSAPEFFDAIAEAAPPKLKQFEPQNLSMMAWAYATLGHASPALFTAIAQAAVTRADFLKEPQALSNTVWAFATVDHQATELFETIAASVPIPLLHSQAVANMAWGYAAADVPSKTLFADPAFGAVCSRFADAFPISEQRQLHQWQLWLEERGEAWPELPSPLREVCSAAFSAEEGNPSRFQNEVCKALAGLGLQLREEVRTPQGYSLDAVVLFDGHDVAVEVDGPTHFLQGEWARRPTGSTALKRRQLRAAGWPLLPVPYWEWSQFNGAPAAQQAYMARALKATVQAVPGHEPAWRNDLMTAEKSLRQSLLTRSDTAARKPQRIPAVSAAGAAAKAAPAPPITETASGAPSSTGAAAPLSWNAFRSSVKGQGFSREEVSRRYKEQLTSRSG